MAYQLNDKQYTAVVALDGPSRCAHFIGRAADWQEVWGVRNDEGWFVPVTPDGLEYFPVWPHPDYAQKITDLNFPGHVATGISLGDFLTLWLPRFQNDGVKVGVFPNEQWGFWLMEPGELIQSLENEAAQYE